MRGIIAEQKGPEEDTPSGCGQHQLTSFSPQMWLMVETEVGLEAGPMTETTPLGRI